MRHVIAVLLVIILMAPLLACGVKSPPLPPLKGGIQESKPKKPQKETKPKEESKRKKKQ